MTTQIQNSKLVLIARRLGLTVLEQSSQFKIIGNADKKFYIPKHKSGFVVRIELSGWSHPDAILWEQACPTKPSPSKKITHVLDLERDEPTILRDFYRMARSIAQETQHGVEQPTPVVKEQTPPPDEDVVDETTGEVLYEAPIAVVA
jgi:hypothetical protein